MQGQVSVIRKFISVGLAVSLAFASGCRSAEDWSFTSRLWTGDAFSRYKLPAAEPRLELFADEARSDVLVIYDEIQEKDRRVVRRAFFVNPNVDRITAGHRPHFVDPSAAHGLKSIPILNVDEHHRMPRVGLAILRSEHQHQFTLYSDGKELGTITLPSYGSGGAAIKSLLTPLTVTGDTIMVASVVGLILGLIYLQAGGPG